MNRKDWEKQIYASDLNPTARWVTAVVGSFGNWTESRTVWPSTKAIADMAGMTRGTVQNYMDALVEQNWLRHVRTRPGNIKEYELLEVDTAVVESFGILAKPKRGSGSIKNSNQLSIATTTEISTDEKQMSNDSTSSCRMEEKQLSNGETPVVESPDTNLKEPTNKNLLVTTSKSPVADAPVDSNPLNSTIKEDEEVIITPKRNFLTTLEERSFRQMTSHLEPEVREEAMTTLLTTKVEGTCFEDKVGKILAELGEEVW